MSMAVGLKVLFELVAAAGGLIFISGLALRGRGRDIATTWGAAVIGLAGLALLLESLFGLLDASRIPSAMMMLIFGTAVTARVVHKRNNSTHS